MQDAAQCDLAHPDRRDEAVRMTRLVIDLDPPVDAVGDYPADGVDLAIEQVDLVARDPQPAAAHDPAAPAADLSHLGSLRVIDQRRDGLAQRVGVEPMTR